MNGYLAQWDKVSSIAMYGANAVTEITGPTWEFTPDGSNDHVSVTKTNLQVGGHRLWFDLARDGLHQVYLTKTRYAWMNIFVAFNPGIMRELVS